MASLVNEIGLSFKMAGLFQAAQQIEAGFFRTDAGDLRRAVKAMSRELRTGIDIWLEMEFDEFLLWLTA